MSHDGNESDHGVERQERARHTHPPSHAHSPETQAAPEKDLPAERAWRKLCLAGAPAHTPTPCSAAALLPGSLTLAPPTWRSHGSRRPEASSQSHLPTLFSLPPSVSVQRDSGARALERTDHKPGGFRRQAARAGRAP